MVKLREAPWILSFESTARPELPQLLRSAAAVANRARDTERKIMRDGDSIMVLGAARPGRNWQ